MSGTERYHQNRDSAFRQCNIDPKDHSFNAHHIFERIDSKRKRLPLGFPIDSRCNLIPLPIEVHEELHEIMDRTKQFKNNISTRVYLANMAFIDELDLIPQRIYYSDPRDMMRLKRSIT